MEICRLTGGGVGVRILLEAGEALLLAHEKSLPFLVVLTLELWTRTCSVTISTTDATFHVGLGNSVLSVVELRTIRMRWSLWVSILRNIIILNYFHVILPSDEH